MVKNYLKLLQKFYNRQHSMIYKLISLCFGMVLFLALIPLFFLWIGTYFHPINFELSNTLIQLLALGAIALGLFFVIWAVISFWILGEGTPVPFAPNRKFVVKGPYRLCRNPIEFGVIWYYFGICTIFGSLGIGLFAFFTFLILGSAYHKFIEEKELEMRFGQEYLTYKETTPFLIPIGFKIFFNFFGI